LKPITSYRLRDEHHPCLTISVERTRDLLSGRRRGVGNACASRPLAEDVWPHSPQVHRATRVSITVSFRSRTGKASHPGLEVVPGAQLETPHVLLLAEVTQGSTVQPEHTETQLKISDPGVQQLGCDRIAAVVGIGDDRQRRRLDVTRRWLT